MGSDGTAKAVNTIKKTADGRTYITGTTNLLTGDRSSYYIAANEMGFVDPDGAGTGLPTKPFYYVDGRLYASDLTVTRLRNNTVMVPVRAAGTSPIAGTFTDHQGAPPTSPVLTTVIKMAEPGWIEATAYGQQGYSRSDPSGAYSFAARIMVDSVQIPEAVTGDAAPRGGWSTGGSFYAAEARNYAVRLEWGGVTNITLNQRALFVKGFPFTE